MSPSQGHRADPSARRPDESLPREARLSRRGDFLRCYRTGRRRHGAVATLHVVPNGLSFARLGITASRKVGKAVARQRLKRRVREVFRRWERRSSLPAVDLVVHLKPEAAKASFAEMKGQLETLLRWLLASTDPLPRRAAPESPPGS